ncbi:glucokinase [Rhizophlyctis rosea]|uniref:Phosphotransferase n=1 Tax=Rhizophlyctis rosea TaxID=64517 RepID=A0AAD5X904_9FUNG|nr:glucokinase [Rhizophlyctis rosea]
MVAWNDNITPVFAFGLTTGIALTAATQYLLTALVGNNRKQIVEVPVPSEPLNGHSLVRKESGILTQHTRSLLRLEKEFTVSGQRLQTLVRHMVQEMKKGLAADGHQLKMIPSFVVRRPTGNETGSVLALDLGGSNFRVCEVYLEGQGRLRMRHRKYVVGDDLKRASGRVLFDFFAEKIEGFLDEIGADKAIERNLGFTFSFPVGQPALAQGHLLHWNKGFQCEGVVNRDVVQLLAEALNRRNLKIKVTALVNDTVGTLISHAYTDPQTHIGVILGTGTNAAYFERIEEIGKWTGPNETGEMVINTEWGAYCEPSVLPITPYDLALDRASTAPKMQIFEKMISGMYLGEIVRYVLLDLISTGELFKGRGSKKLDTPYNFETANMSRIERDHSLELSDTKAVLEDILGIPTTSIGDRRVVKTVCELVGTRAARLSAAGIAAIVTKMNRLDACTVALDGSVFEHYPHFANRMRDALREMLGITAENIILELGRDGSGQGAALIAAIHH